MALPSRFYSWGLNIVGINADALQGYQITVDHEGREIDVAFGCANYLKLLSQERPPPYGLALSILNFITHHGFVGLTLLNMDFVLWHYPRKPPFQDSQLTSFSFHLKLRKPS